MIDAQIDGDHALIHVTSGSLDVTYEIRYSELSSRQTSSPGLRYTRTGKFGYVFDLVGATREPVQGQAPYIFGCMDFDRTVLRALSKARHLERVWRNTKVKASA